MRLIDADALIARFGKQTHDTRPMVSLMDIDKAPTIASPRDWTPCAEGLPDDCRTVLATIKDNCGNDLMFACYNGTNWFDGYGNKLPIIAWQPLPAPYNPDHNANGKVEQA